MTLPDPPLSWSHGLLRTAGVLLSLLANAACAPAGRPGRGPLDAEFTALGGGRVAPESSAAAPDPRLWRDARRRLAELRREAQGDGPRTLRVRVSLQEPFTHRTLEARGAIAIAPPPPEGGSAAVAAPDGALRMILLGPGGTTALDLWARGDRFRFAIPAIDLLRRGDASTPRASLRGLPVDFLRWWLLRPAAGSLIWYGRSGAADDFVLREGDAIIELRTTAHGRIGARRATWSVAPGKAPQLLDEEVVIAEGMGCATVRYAQASTGLVVTVTCEAEERGHAPDPRAFIDPDALPAGGDS